MTIDAIFYRNFETYLFSLCFFVGHAPHFDVDKHNKDITLKLENIDINGIRSKDTYIFKDLHIHLGKKENKGSEHSIDGKFYPMEVTFTINNDHAFVQMSMSKHYFLCIRSMNNFVRRDKIVSIILV